MLPRAGRVTTSSAAIASAGGCRSGPMRGFAEFTSDPDSGLLRTALRSRQTGLRGFEVFRKDASDSVRVVWCDRGHDSTVGDDLERDLLRGSSGVEVPPMHK